MATSTWENFDSPCAVSLITGCIITQSDTRTIRVFQVRMVYKIPVLGAIFAKDISWKKQTQPTLRTTRNKDGGVKRALSRGKIFVNTWFITNIKLFDSH